MEACSHGYKLNQAATFGGSNLIVKSQNEMNPSEQARRTAEPQQVEEDVSHFKSLLVPPLQSQAAVFNGRPTGRIKAEA